VSILLRIAAVVSLGWAVVLLVARPLALGLLGNDPVGASVTNGLAILHAAWALMLWRAAADPSRDRTVVYGALVVFGLRAAKGTYEVLYVLEGTVAVVNLIDMVTSLALFVGILNALPGALRGSNRPATPAS
jgi:hypothetical protein